MNLQKRDNLLWYALQIQSKLQTVAAAVLSGKGYEAHAPLYPSRRRWSDRVKEVDLPLFPGYIFCRFDVRERLPILTTPGVLSVVGAGKNPIAVDDKEIETIREVLRSGHGVQPWPFLNTGSRVFIERGPLKGVEGIIINADKVRRLVVSVSLLQRSVAVEIDREWAIPISNPTAKAIGPRSVTIGVRPRRIG
jgi:transcription antitermination factor NusG